MNHRRALPVVLTVTLIWLTAPAATTGRLDTAEYAARRARVMDAIGDGVAIVLGASTPASDVGFRQGNDFYYLTGVDVPDATLVIDGQRKESVLFLTMDERTADGLAGFLSGLYRRGPTLYTPFRPEEIGPENSNEKFNALQRSMTANPWDGRLTRELQFVTRLRERFPQYETRDLAPIIWDLRKFKSPAEIALMRESAQLGVEAHKAFIRSTQPGVAERSLAAVFDFVTALGGARGLAYYTIIMSGKTGCSKTATS
jgi:Xaa-Pro aminopeptidase